MYTFSDQIGKQVVITDVAAGASGQATRRIKAVGGTVTIAGRTPSIVRRDASLPVWPWPGAEGLTGEKLVFG